MLSGGGQTVVEYLADVNCCLNAKWLFISLKPQRRHPMKTYIVTDLTRFKDDDRVCTAVVDPETGECFRPLPYLKSEVCRRLDLQPGAKITGVLTRKRGNSRPHIEDASHQKLKYLGPCTAEEFKQVMQMTLSEGVNVGFGYAFPPGTKVVPKETPADRSLVTVRVQPTNVDIVEDRYRAGKIRLNFTDATGQLYQYLSITDRGFFDFAMKHQHDSELHRVTDFLKKQDEIYLRLGLGRCYQSPNGPNGYWLQANGIYSFPDYPKEIRKY